MSSQAELEEEETLAIWNGLEDLASWCIDRESGQVSSDFYEEFGSMHGPFGYVRVLRDVRRAASLDNGKHFALEAEFDGHVEFKHAYSDELAANAFSEMQAYLSE